MRIEVKGTDQVFANLKSVVDKIENGAMDGVELSAKSIAIESAALAPVDTGNLRASHYTYRKGKAVPPSMIIPGKGVDRARLMSGYNRAMSSNSQQVNKKMVRVGAYAFYALQNEVMHPSKARFMRRAISKNLKNVLTLAAAGGRRAIR